MKIQTLEYFVVLAESRSINEAAQKLYIPQPSLSKSLHLFEKEIGVQLFHRTGQGIILTDAGKKLLPEAKQVLSLYNGWKSLEKQEELRQVDIYIHSSFPDFILPDIILRMQKKYMGLSIHYYICAHPERFISSSAEKPVLAFFPCCSREHLKKYSRLQGNPPLVLFWGNYCCLLNARNPLAHNGKISPADLESLYYVSAGDSFSNLVSPGEQIFTGECLRRPCINVETASNVIAMILKDPETYTLSYYPALKRHEGVIQGELKPVFFEDMSADMPLCLFYAEQAYSKFPIIREFVQEVNSAAKQFLKESGESFNHNEAN